MGRRCFGSCFRHGRPQLCDRRVITRHCGKFIDGSFGSGGQASFKEQFYQPGAFLDVQRFQPDRCFECRDSGITTELCLYKRQVVAGRGVVRLEDQGLAEVAFGALPVFSQQRRGAANLPETDRLRMPFERRRGRLPGGVEFAGNQQQLGKLTSDGPVVRMRGGKTGERGEGLTSRQLDRAN